MKKNTGKKIGIRWDKYGWKFERTIWTDGQHDYFIVNGCEIDLDEARAYCDHYYIV